MSLLDLQVAMCTLSAPESNITSCKTGTTHSLYCDFFPQKQYTDGGRLVQQCTDTGGEHNPVW